MPEVEISIGGRFFEVACQAGEEHFLQEAASLLDAEAQTLTEATGRLSEAKMLLMSGLMLADNASAMRKELSELRAKFGAQELLIAQLREADPAAPADHVEPDLSELAAVAEKSEALASLIENLASAS
ncbi:MAG: cell division protein ZapA [Pseudomonadota bacterium]